MLHRGTERDGAYPNRRQREGVGFTSHAELDGSGSPRATAGRSFSASACAYRPRLQAVAQPVASHECLDIPFLLLRCRSNHSFREDRSLANTPPPCHARRLGALNERGNTAQVEQRGRGIRLHARPHIHTRGRIFPPPLHSQVVECSRTCGHSMDQPTDADQHPSGQERAHGPRDPVVRPRVHQEHCFPSSRRIPRVSGSGSVTLLRKRPRSGAAGRPGARSAPRRGPPALARWLGLGTLEIGYSTRD
jgi:hypothetical protein